MNELNNVDNINIYSEWGRSKAAILDAYYNVINSYPGYMTYYKIYKQENSELSKQWRENIYKLFLMLKPYEKDLININSEQIEEILLDKKDKLIKLTNEIIQCDTIKDLTAIGKKLNADPIKIYKAENYG